MSHNVETVEAASQTAADQVEAAENVAGVQNGAAKRGELFGGALTDEALDSSRRVLSANRGNKNALVGLQQWFTLPAAAQLIADVFCSRGAPDAVLDPTAGSGALLAPFSPGRRFGIEIDPDHVARKDDPATYNAVTGDAQKVVPMLRAAGLRWPAIALNPPFGLSWRDPAHARGEANSTHLSYLWALDLLSEHGQGALVCGSDRLAREVLSTEQGRGVYAVVDVEGPLFDGVDLATSIAFFVHPENLVFSRRDGTSGSEEQAPTRLSAPRADLPSLAADVEAAREHAAAQVSPLEISSRRDHLLEGFETDAKEHQRRRKQAQERRAATRYDATLRGARLGVSPSAFARLALTRAGTLREVQLLDNQHVSYLGQNKKAWAQLLEAEEARRITIDPALRDRAETVMAEAEKVSTPLFPLRPQMRLGWLTDLDKIPCIKDDPERGFVAGEEYPLATASRVHSRSERRMVEDRHGEWEPRRFEVERKLLEVRIGGHSFDEGEENISYIAEHFELPDPGCVATRHPEEVRNNRELLKQIARENGFKLKLFQLDHLSRLLVKRRGMLAHDPGLGKTPMQMCLAEAEARLGADPQALFCVPQDLVRQWQKAARGFFNRRFEVISTPAKAREVAKRVEAGERGWWLTYFECLSVVGRHKELLPHRYLDHRKSLAHRLIEHKKRKGVATGVPEFLTAGSRATTADACPSCGMDTGAVRGWNGEACGRCGYVHRSKYVKTAASHLTTAFKNGVKCIDEVSEIRGDDSLRSKAVRGITRGPHNYGATGTPICNFVSDAFWGLAVTLGAGTAAFPYSHRGGKQKYESDFAVIEYKMGREGDGEDDVRKNRKVLPQVSNVSQFWRLVQPGVSRCRKDQTGEPLVEKIFHPTRVPMGAAQKRQHRFWLSHFEDYFEWKHPHHHLVDQGLVEKFAASLGQLWRLETAATLPASDEPSRRWPVAQERLGELSNWTPANLRALEVAMEHAARGEKVLIGSDLVLTGKWIADRLCEKNIKAVHITEERAGKVGTKNPRKRAREVEEFVSGDAQVLCAGVGAMKLGHDLAVASTVIVSGLPYGYMQLVQFLDRVHRLTSEKPVSVYVVMSRGSLADEKWRRLKDKGAAADLAFDGELSVSPEKPVDWSKVLEEMKQRGMAAYGDEEVLEAEVEAAWRAISPLTPPSPTNHACAPPLRPAVATEAPGTTPSLFDIFTEEDAGSRTQPFVNRGPAEQLALFDFAEPSPANEEENPAA